MIGISGESGILRSLWLSRPNIIHPVCSNFYYLHSFLPRLIGIITMIVTWRFL